MPVKTAPLTSNETTAIIFGAGASSPPLESQQGLVDALLRATSVPRIALAQKYLRQVFPGLPNPSLRFEDVVGPLEIAEAEEYWFHLAGRGADERPAEANNKAVLDALDTWVAMCLDPPSIPKPQKPQKISDKGEYARYYAPAADAGLVYSRLIHFLRDTGLLATTAFLSMNYDVLLDRVLYASGTHVPDYMVDGFYEGPPSVTKTESFGSNVGVLKLHGSLNWRSCDDCHILRNLRSFVVWPLSHCIDCGARSARPMLIRPTLLKDFRHRVWQGVWRAAGHVLAEAMTWVFVGYSLPLADVWMLRMLAQSCRSGNIEPQDRHIIVVNLDSAVRDRFGLLFPGLNFRQETFETWVGNCQKTGRLK